jgi:hypothetical protein
MWFRKNKTSNMKEELRDMEDRISTLNMNAINYLKQNKNRIERMRRKVTF